MTSFTKDDPKCMEVLARLDFARKEMLKRGTKPLVRATPREPQRATWRRIEVMSTADAPATVTPIRRKK